VSTAGQTRSKATKLPLRARLDVGPEDSAGFVSILDAIGDLPPVEAGGLMTAYDRDQVIRVHPLGSEF
jgi:hypothetical protein